MGLNFYERLTVHRSYGWRPSLPDVRNKPAVTAGLTIKSEVDPRAEMQDPYDQLELGSCTANAYAGAVEYDALLNGVHFGTPSRLAIYYGERLREGSVNYDAGAEGHDAFKDGRKYGVGPETLWAYDIEKFRNEPSRGYLDSRTSHKVLDYRHPAQAEGAFKRILSNDQTIAFGFTVYESFESEEAADTGVIPLPSRNEQVIGGHEVLLIGYKVYKGTQYALCRNSWGTDWGQSGYFLMQWKYILDPKLASDFRTIYRPA